MLDRGVEALMMKNSFYYPFEKISNFLRGTDLVVGNLEGPIVKEPKDFGPHSLEFNFSQEVLAALKFVKINLFSLANNHILNRNRQGLTETKELLSQNKFYFMGDPIDCQSQDVYEIDNMIYLALNKTFPSNCSDEQIANLIKQLRKANPTKLLVVNMHWGIEYKIVNSPAQQQLAHLIIDNGADLIIGHHPHVVQNIEEYKGKLIFYSLGNFIFDQYFKEEVQQGLAVGWEIYPQKYVFNLFPLQSKLSQPDLMSDQEKMEFLAQLAKNSSLSLEAQIKSGKIEVNSKF
jgi:poly-gamma-glutamate synthesis protein (capsule biosynthesis protein)